MTAKIGETVQEFADQKWAKIKPEVMILKRKVHNHHEIIHLNTA